MDDSLFNSFLESNDSVWVYKAGKLLFKSSEQRLVPLVSYIAGFPPVPDVVIYDRVVGNAAALLLKKALCSKVYSPVASEIAVKTLDALGISYFFQKVVPYILNQAKSDLCPMEKASIGKSPEEFYQLIKTSVRQGRHGGADNSDGYC